MSINENSKKEGTTLRDYLIETYKDVELDLKEAKNIENIMKEALK